MYGQIYSNSVKGTVRSIFSKNQLQKKLNKSELIFKHYFLDQLIEIQNQDLQQKIVITKWSLGSLYIHNISFNFVFEHPNKQKTVMQCFLEWR